MSTQPTASTRYGKRERAAQIGVSATTFLLLCLWLGPDRAVFLITVAAIGFGWFWLCRRYPAIAWLTMGFLRGLFGR